MKRILIIAGKIGICLLIFILNDYLVLKVLKITEKYKIEDESNIYFQVVVVTPQGAELFLIREQLEAFIADRKDYTFLIPAGQELKIQEEARASYRQRYTGDSYPSLKVERLDAEHQLIELYMSGDPRDITLWYEATDKKFVPKYELMISAMMLVPFSLLSLILAPFEYKVGKWLFKKLRNRKRFPTPKTTP